MNTTSMGARPATPPRTQTHRVALALALSVLVATSGLPLDAQVATSSRLWAAQTGQNQVTLAWDSVSGAATYRIYVGDPTTPATFTRRPVSVLSASARGGVLAGIQRMTSGITLESVDADGRILGRQSFNPITPATSFPPPTPPTQLTAEASSSSEVRVTWDAVPGATAYFIGRAVGGSGYGTVCALCSTEPTYVDQAVMSGQRHAYTVAAIFPSGVSSRVNSNAVTPGQVATAGQTGASGTTTSTGTATPTASTGTGTSTAVSGAPAGAPAPPPVVTATATGPGKVRLTWQASPSPDVTAYYIQRDPTGLLPGFVNRVDANIRLYDDGLYPASVFASGPLRVTYSVVSYSPTGTAATTANVVLVPSPTGSTTTYTPPGQPAGTLPIGTGSSTTGTTGTTSTSTSGGNVPAGGPLPPTLVTASAVAPATVRLTWQPTASPGVTGYYVQRNTSGALVGMVIQVAATPTSFDDGPFDASAFTSGPLSLSYNVAAITSTGTAWAPSNTVTVQPPGTHLATPAPPPCRLDYQRADNMWAGWGKPDGSLGTETIQLAVGESKVFLTDWKYEKLRNNGTTYYGSHLRVATNVSSGKIRLRYRSLVVMAANLLGGSGSEFWTGMLPNTSQTFQADLMEVHCIP